MIKKKSDEKSHLHKRNKNRKPYDLGAMLVSNPELKKHLKTNKNGLDSIDFSNPNAVKILNRAILKQYYKIDYWEFPDENLCPPIPGRAEYIHHAADLLGESNHGKIPTGETVTCLDIGIGASCIYPILGVMEYEWNFIGSDIDSKSIASAQNIINKNPSLKGKISCKIQHNPKAIFRGIISKEDKIDIVLCNPPFHATMEEAAKGTRRKIKNLTGQKAQKLKLNFSGNSNELVYQGGEFQFVRNMISESKEFARSCCWFSSLVSKESNVDNIYKNLEYTRPSEIKTILLKTGNKTIRIIAWTYFTAKERQLWHEEKRKFYSET